MYEVRVNGIVEESIVDGPGLRYVVFTQGCPHSCPGCHNPETHNAEGGYVLDAATVLDEFRENPLLSGITFSGGEPFLQPAPLCFIGREVRALGKSVVIYTGFTLERLARLAETDKDVGELLALADTLVDGPYVESLRDLQLDMRGSGNQRVLKREEILARLHGLPVEEAC